ncbi:hypothetical protein Tco_1020238 [Tanacetum coccineum]|uniref:Uncharacterized protein n=1 Tax=Tanacetum coccineum TaxID=301880 RepID=A0ABQ5FZJ8_9ASTR
MISPAFNGIQRFCKAGRSCGRALGKRKQPIVIRTGVKGAEHGDGRRKIKNTRQNLKMGYPGRTKGRQLGNMYTEDAPRLEYERPHKSYLPFLSQKIKGQRWPTSPIRHQLSKEASQRKYMTTEDDKSLAMNLALITACETWSAGNIILDWGDLMTYNRESSLLLL